MNSHHLRYVLIMVAYVVAVTALVLATVFDASSETIAALITASGLLTPALVDAAAVERRRTIPGVPAVADDVKLED